MNQPFFNHTLRFLIFSASLLTLLTFCFPTVYSDAIVYAVISKNIILNQDWINLTFMGKDWLDKPHLPFWLTALSFKAFGISPIAYLIPGMLVHFFGAWFTFKLARLLYNPATAWIACLIYLTTIRLLLSTADLRAEAFLVAEIMPACYYWLRYYQATRFRFLLLGAFFTALAMMTKGIFVLATIGSGLMALWIMNKEWRHFGNFKWLAALFLSFLFILPELVSLYLQFDLHPEKVVFDQTGVSGIRFFFWDSQFGRFFNFGPIRSAEGNPFFFLHTFLWAFLPWTLIFSIALYDQIKNFKQQTEKQKKAFIYLSASFVIPFTLFSLTKFQLDHYLDIILPFAAIFIAHFLSHCFQRKHYSSWLSPLQSVFCLLLSLFFLVICFMGAQKAIGILTFVIIFTLCLAVYFAPFFKEPLLKLLTVSTVVPLIIFVGFSSLNHTLYKKYDAGYKMVTFLNSQEKAPVYLYRQTLTSVNFYATENYALIQDFANISTALPVFYLVVENSDLPAAMSYFPQAETVFKASGIASNIFMKRLLNDPKHSQEDLFFTVLKVSKKL